MSSAQSAARFLASYQRRPMSASGILGRPTPADTMCLREIMLDHVGYFPRRPERIFDEVHNDYGSCHERRLWRTLAWLVAAGKIVQVSEGYRRPR